MALESPASAQYRIPRQTRPSRDDLESRTPTGRALHWIESRLLDGAHAIGLFTACHEIERLHDATRDRILLDAIALGDRGAPWIEVRASLLEAVRIDALADEADREGSQHVYRDVRRAFQRIGAMVEKSFAAIRSQR